MPFKPKARVKEVGHPKFYLFDVGVTRALAGRHVDPLGLEEKGSLFETYILHELQAYNEYTERMGHFSYWRTESGVEVDFIYTIGQKTYAFEVKATDRMRPEFNKGLKALSEHVPLAGQFVILMDGKAAKHGEILILPAKEFIHRLYAGEIIE